MNNLIKLNSFEVALCLAIKDNRSQEDITKLMLLYEELGDDSIWSYSKENKVQSIVAHTFLEIINKRDLSQKWNRAHEENYTRISSYLAELDRVAELLIKFDIRIAVIENAAVARGIFSCPGCFEFGDVDILVFDEDFPMVGKVLLDNGYVDHNNATKLENRRIYAADISAGKNIFPFRINMQKSLVARKWFNTDQEPTFQEIFSRALVVNDSHVLMLCPEDNLFQICIHNSAHSYVRKPGIRLHLDIDRVVNRSDIDWDIFLNQVSKYKVNTRAYFSLMIPKILFNTPVPDAVFDRLTVPTWKRKFLLKWICMLGLFNLNDKKFGKVEFIFFSIMMYDNFMGFLISIVPSSDYLMKKYGFKNPLLVPYFHVKRLMDLVIKR